MRLGSCPKLFWSARIGARSVPFPVTCGKYVSGGLLTAKRPRTVTLLLQRSNNGDEQALSEVVPIVYQELRWLARRTLNSHSRSTITTTLLINEAYLRLVDQRPSGIEHRGHFLGIAARLMRQILVDDCRKRNAQKRGSGLPPVPLNEFHLGYQEDRETLIALNQALDRLAAVDERKVQVVELKFFGGFTIEEVAEALGVSPVTVERDWAFAKAWLFRELTRDR